MAEAFEQFKQFEYKNNSNLVLQREAGPSHLGPTGEPESLVGRLPGKMGDRRMVARIPKELLSGAKSYITVDGTAIKTELRGTRAKKRRLDMVLEKLNSVPNDAPAPAGEDPVAVVFESDDEAEDRGGDSAASSASSDTDDEENMIYRGGGDTVLATAVPDDAPDEERHRLEPVTKRAPQDSATLPAEAITAHWLQGELLRLDIVSHTDVSQKLLAVEQAVLETLAISDLQECEAGLVEIIGVDNFDFIAVLLHNRWRINFLTRLRQAQSEEERVSVEKAMRQSNIGRKVLTELQEACKVRDTEKIFEETIEAEAARLTEPAASAPLAEDVNMDSMNPSAELVDLEKLSFKVEDKLVGLDKVVLPKGTERINTKEWEEVLVPEKTREVSASDTVDVDQILPAWALPSFAEIRRFNPIQTKVAPTAWSSAETNMLVCAPTGAGKTNIALLAMLEVISRYMKRPSGSKNECSLGQFKIVYVSPMKALVAEQVTAFRKRLDALELGLRVSELTGDMNMTQAEIEATQVIVTTPEKWDVITRKSGERIYTQLVRLMIFDEVHLLHDRRGSVLEALIARALRQYESTGQHIRFVGLSATLPNALDVALFLRVPPEKGLFVFGGEYRPVPLRQNFIGIKTKSAMKRYDAMNDICYQRLVQYAGRHQVLIFCHSRKETARTAKYIRDKAFQSGEIVKFFSDTDGDVSKEILATEKEKVNSADLRDLITFGFGIHHAGMTRSDRKLVEALFADKHIQVLVSTATLAWGVNLPAHTVIIKGTQIYSPDQGRWIELPPLDVIQMVGRAGRPPFDKFGEGIIITQQNQLQYYVSLTNQQLPIESQLMGQLQETINAEISLGSIRTREQAAEWLLYTYLFVRMRRAPKLYHVPEELAGDISLAQWRLDLAHAALTALDNLRLINYEATSGRINPTALCRAAANYYLRPKTVAVLNQGLTPDLNQVDLLRLFGQIHEFSNVPCRPEEKPELAKCIDKVPIPVKGQIGESATKINILLQAYISGLKLDGFALQADMGLVVQNAPRVLRAMFDITLRRGWARVAELALTYAKVVDRRMWSSMSPLRQFGILSLADLRRIEARSIPWSAYFDMNEGELGEMLKNQQLGQSIYTLLRQFPQLKVECFVLPITENLVQIDMTLVADFEWNRRISRHAELFWVFVENVDRTKILYADSLVISRTEVNNEHYMTFTVPLDEPRSPNYFVKVISDRWLGSERIFPISFKDLVLPAKNPSPTNFLGLQPIPITAANFPTSVRELYPEVKFFTSLQSQVFQPLYGTDDNILICAPHTSGRALMAEIAILRLLDSSSDPECIYIAPNEKAAQSRYRLLVQRFSPLGLKIGILTGNLVTDTKLLSKCHVCVARASYWEALSRRWRVRKALQRLQLMIIESIESISDPLIGSDLEIGVSRMRLMSDLLKSDSANAKENKLRIVAIGCPIGNAADLADWLGATGQMYAFHPTVRASALDLSITRIDIPDRNRRLVASYTQINHAIRKLEALQSTARILVICTERREARQCCIELLLQAGGEQNPKKFIGCISEEELKAQISQYKLDERILPDILAFGVGLAHEGMTEAERHVVYNLYKRGFLRALVVTHQLVYEMHLNADLVIVQDTEIWDPLRTRWSKYSAEMLSRFLGFAEPNDANVAASSSAVILCKPARHEEIKRSIFEPMQVESNADMHLPEHLLAEIVTGTIHNKQECIDWFTWTFAYRRLIKNPNFYGLRRADEILVSEYISETIENACENLVKAGCLSVAEDDLTLNASNLGLVAVFYALKSGTVEGFVKLLTPTSGLKQIIIAISIAKEVSTTIQIRQGEETLLQLLATECGIYEESMSWTEAHVKARILLHSHLLRLALTPDLQRDLNELLILAEKCCHALVDVLSSTNRLKPLIISAELSQMLTQGCMREPLLQLPHFTSEFVKLSKEKYNIGDCFALANAEDEVRDSLFKQMQLSDTAIEEVAAACNAVPVLTIESVETKDLHTLSIKICREVDEDIDATRGNVQTMYFPVAKEEQWWLLATTADGEKLLGLKRVTLTAPENQVALNIDAVDVSDSSCKVFCISDSYIGCDREFAFERR